MRGFDAVLSDGFGPPSFLDARYRRQTEAELNLTLFTALDVPATRPKLEPDLFPIGDVAPLRRESADAALLRGQRSANSQRGTSRLYDARTRLRLQLILKGKQLGFTLAEIHEMLRTKGDDGISGFELALQPD